MDSTRWERIQTLFHEVADLPAPEQRVFLKAACGDDDVLVADVLALVEEDARGLSLLDRDLAQVAQEMLDEAVPASLPFKEFGPYRIQKALGEGGMGVVYLAERIDLGSLVAIKLLRDAWLSPARRERFASEQRTLAQLNHPSIARLYDADTLDDGTPWFAMEYVEGIPLTDYCAAHACSIQERLQLFRAVCEAVQYAHQHAVIHRDLKPSNILVKPDGTIRLLDFGIAKQLESLETLGGRDQTRSDQTMTGLRLMTPAYAAPEQVRGDRVGIQTDVYSLGVVLYELLAGGLPFDLSKLTPGEAEAVIVGQDPEKPSAVANRMAERPGADPNLPSATKSAWADLDVLCLSAMHKDTQRRYQSVEALIRDIDHYLKGEPLEARSDTFRYRMGKFVRRNRRAVSASALVFMIVIILVVFFTVRLAKARNAALEEAARTQRIQRFMMNLFQGGDQSVGPGDSLRVVTLLDRGVQEAQSLNGDPKVQAELYQTLGTIYDQLGKFDEADSLLHSALERRKALFGPDSTEVAESLVALGQLRSDQARYDEAEQFTRQGLDMSKRHLPATDPRVGKATYTLGEVVENQGKYDQAISVLNEAVRFQSASGEANADLAESLTELANTQFYAGHLDISNSLNLRVLAMDRKLYGERHPNVAEDLINLGAIQSEWGHYAETERYYRQALDIIQNFYGKDHPETASVMTLLGRSLNSQGRFNEAADLLRESLGIEERVYGDAHPRVASALGELGKVAMQQGKLDEAEADFRRQADIYREVYKGKHYYIGSALANLGGVYMERKQYSRAERSFRDALQIYAETLTPDHLNVAIVRIKLGRALISQHRDADAEVESLAGYGILMKQSNPPANWLQNARKDLVEEYSALHQPDKAAKFEAELAETDKPVDVSKK
ncbi:MAG TPA: serine/threonine-protein kinase [Terriglobales bacterium]|nr:serine/threonine-protein kinase [Terriglobales bacterium]